MQLLFDNTGIPDWDWTKQTYVQYERNTMILPCIVDSDTLQLRNIISDVKNSI